MKKILLVLSLVCAFCSAASAQTTPVAQSVNGALNAARYCTTPGTLDQTCVQNAAAAATGGQQIYIPAGNYSGTSSTIAQSNLHLVLDPGASLDYNLNISGAGFLRSNAVTTTDATVRAGTTLFHGNFSAYSAKQTVLIEQVTNNGSSALELATVSAATTTTLTIASGTRFAYATPNISQVGASAVKVSGNIAAATQTISVACSSLFSTGEIVRIENTTGTDSPGASTAYFEMGRVQACTGTSMTLETALHSSFGNPWIIGMSVLNNVTIQGQGGFIQQLKVENARNVSIDGLVVNTTIAQQIYDFKFSNQRGATTSPSAFYYTYLWNGSISNILAYGSNATSDNGNIKLLGVQNVAVTGVSTWGGVDTSQGSYPFMFDFNYTPYSIWNAGDAISGVSTGSTIGVGGYTVFLGGMHHSSASGITSTGTVELLASNGFTLSSLATQSQVLIQSGSNYHLENFTADSMLIGQVSAVTASIFENFTIWGGSTEVGGGAITIYGGSSNLRFSHGEFPLSNNTFYTINAQSGDENVFYEDLQDYPGGKNFAYSIYTNGTGTETLIANRFAGAIQGTQLPANVPTLAGLGNANSFTQPQSAPAFAGSGSATFAVGPAAGTSPGTPICARGYVCDSNSGVIDLTIGKAPPATGTLITVTLGGVTRSNNPTCTAQALDAVSNVVANVTGVNTTPATELIQAGGMALTAGNRYLFSYSCSGR